MALICATNKGRVLLSGCGLVYEVTDQPHGSALHDAREYGVTSELAGVPILRIQDEPGTTTYAVHLDPHTGDFRRKPRINFQEDMPQALADYLGINPCLEPTVADSAQMQYSLRVEGPMPAIPKSRRRQKEELMQYLRMT